ncbi:ABC transporter ATP-binding protein [Pseudogracilibacillus sp. SO30301A]|uniref:ABC transporter ATP-binding protein n=1 Tax=Pseudogracilibacillus sp. SO30301A TaxID=3098291 RepID=UPI00300E0125
MGANKALELKNISKMYNSVSNDKEFLAVDDISVSIKAGEFVTLLGPSGCGKTTTLRMLAGFEIPTEGDILLGGKKLNDIPANKRNTTMVFQSYALFPHYNIFDNIAYGLKIKKVPKHEIKDKVVKIIKLVGLENLEKRFPGQLSGGQQQRVALARSLVMEPDLLLFDEPLSNLDAKLRVYMRNEIKKIQRRLGLTSVFVTHDQAEALSLSDRIIIMNKGKIEQVGTPQEIYQYPKSEFVADFIGNANFVDGIIKEIGDEYITVDFLGSVTKIKNKGLADFKVNEEVKVVIRPEAINLKTDGNYNGKVTLSTFMGNTQEYSILLKGSTLFVEEPNPAGKTIYREDENVRFSIQEEGLHVVPKKINKRWGVKDDV